MNVSFNGDERGIYSLNPKVAMSNHLALILASLTCFILTGCDGKKEETVTKSARPVSVIELVESDPGRFNRYTGTIASWKSDELGFEVAGRVEFVVEPETDIIAESNFGEGEASSTHTELARLDPTRYELKVASANAAITSAQKERETAQIELEMVLPAEQRAAEAQKLANQAEFERNQILIAEKAVSQRELDYARSRYEQAVAQVDKIKATRKAKAAEVASIDAQIAELEETRRQAEQDVKDCKLKWSVPGQIAKVHVIAGSYVERGQKVVTVQMMHPMKVEVEVAGVTARKLNHRDQAKIYVSQPDGTIREETGFIYTIDPVADPQTLTFTITLMLPNSRIRNPIPEEYRDKVTGRTDAIGRLIPNFGGEVDSLYVNESYLHKDDMGFFVWKILNRRVGTLAGQSERVLEVAKVRLLVRQRRISVLGLVEMREIELPEGAEIDPQNDLVTGKIVLPNGEEAESVTRVFFDVERWGFRPGDLVSVDLAGQPTQPGFYVPLDSITATASGKFVFVVDQAAGVKKARKVRVTVHDAIGTLRRIEAEEGESFSAGDRIVAEGSVFLVDGEPVNIAEQVEVRR